MTDTESTNNPESTPEETTEVSPEATPVSEAPPAADPTPAEAEESVAAGLTLGEVEGTGGTGGAGDDGASPEEAEAAPAPPKPAIKLPAGQHWWWGTGRRKASVARVRIRPGEGKFTVNKKEYTTFFTEERDHSDLMNVLEKTNTKGSIDVHVKVHGGGFTGQAGATLLGLARALKEYDDSLEPILRDNDFLTRDPRRVERKKYGQPGARKRFQFSKR